MNLDFLKLINAGLDTAQNFAQMKNLNNQIIVKQQELEHKTLLKRDEQTRQLNLNNQIKQNETNLKSVKEDIDEDLLVYERHGSSFDILTNEIKAHASSKDAKTLYDEEEGRFTDDFRYLKSEANTIQEQNKLDDEQYNKSNLMLEYLNSDIFKLDDNITHMQHVGTELGLKGLKDKEDILFYIDRAENPETGLKIFKTPQIEKDDLGNIQYGDDGLPIKVTVGDEVQYEDGYNTKGLALLKKQHNVSGVTYGFFPGNSKNSIKRAQITDNNYAQINTKFLELASMERSLKGKDGKSDWVYTTTGNYGIAPLKGTYKQYNDPKSVAQIQPHVEEQILKILEHSDTAWLQDENSGYKQWQASGRPEDRTKFIANSYKRYIGTQWGYNQEGEKTEHYTDTVDGYPNLIAGRWAQAYATDKVDLVTDPFSLGIEGLETDYGEHGRDNYLYANFELFKLVYDVNPYSSTTSGLLKTTTNFPDAEEEDELGNFPPIGG